MRITYSQLQTKCKNITQNQNNDDANLQTFFQDEINLATRFIYAELQNYQTMKSDTRTTVVNTQYYQAPPDFMNMETVTGTIGAVTYTLDPVDSQRQWDKLNAVIFTGTAIPRYFFIREFDIGIWPIPQSIYTLTYNYAYRLRDMSQDDVADESASVTNNSATVLGIGTSFDSTMIGRWFQNGTDLYWYHITAVADATHLTLNDVFRGQTITDDAYIIAETPGIPPELHELIPYRVAASYFSGFRKDENMANYWNNMFWTGDPNMSSNDIARAVGGLLGAKKRYSKRSNSRVIRKKTIYDTLYDRVWMTTLSDSS